MYKLSIEAELYGGENSRAVQKWHIFFLTSKLFCVPYVVMSSHPTCSLVWFDFLRVSHSLGQENTAKNTHLTVTGYRLSVSIPFLLPAAHSLVEKNESR